MIQGEKTEAAIPEIQGSDKTKPLTAASRMDYLVNLSIGLFFAFAVAFLIAALNHYVSITPSAQMLCGDHNPNAFWFLQGLISSFLNMDTVSSHFPTIGEALPGITSVLFGNSFSDSYALLFTAVLTVTACAFLFSMIASSVYGIGRALGGKSIFDAIYKVGFYMFFSSLNLLVSVSFPIIIGAGGGTILSVLRLFQQVAFQTEKEHWLLANSVSEGRFFLVLIAIMIVAQYKTVFDRKKKLEAFVIMEAVMNQTERSEPSCLWRLVPYAFLVPAVSLLAIVVIELILLIIVLIFYLSLFYIAIVGTIAAMCAGAASNSRNK